MKRILTLFLLAVGATAPAEQLDPSQFTYRAPVTFPGYTDANNTLANFPVLVRLAETPGGFSYADSSADGADIRFALADGTVLASEVSLWNPNGESLVWVGVPALSPDAVIYLYWGGSRNFPASQTDGSVWTDADYFAVWHMDEASGATTAADSAGGDFDGTHVNTTTGVDGKVGRGVRISDGPWNDTASRNAGIQTTAYSGKGTVFTFTSWLKYKAGQNPGTDRLISSKSSHTDTSGWEISFQRYSPRRIDVRGSSSATAVGNYDLFANNWMGSWQHLAVLFNGENVAVFLNGAYKTYGSTAALVDTDRVLTIGINSSFSEDSFKGVLDEMRLRSGRSSDQWIAAEYNSVNDASFASIGEPEYLVTGQDVAILGTVAVSAVASHSATLSWTLRTASSDSGATVTAYYGTAPGNLSQSLVLASGADIATGDHVSTLSGLTCDTDWYVRVVATGVDESSESVVVPFTTVGAPAFGPATATADGLSVTISDSLSDAGSAPLAVTAFFGATTASWSAVDSWAGVTTARSFAASAIAPSLGNYVAGFTATGTCPDCGHVFSVSSDTVSVIVSGECRWTGAEGDLSWNTPGNWSSGTVPGPLDTVVFPAGSVAAGATIALDAAQTVSSVYDESGVSFTIGSADDVSAGWILSIRDYVREGDDNVTLTVATPLRFVEPESGTNTLVLAAGTLRARGAVSAAAAGQYLLQSGPGTFALAAAGGNTQPHFLVTEGVLQPEADSALKGSATVGGGDAAARLNCTVNLALGNVGTVTALTNGYAQLRQTNWGHMPDSMVARDGGTVQVYDWSYGHIIRLTGGTIQGGFMNCGSYSGQGIYSYASALPSFFRCGFNFSEYGGASISVEDGEAIIDLTITSGISWANNSWNSLSKNGAGTLRMTGSTGAKSSQPFQLNGGTLLCDTASGTPIGNTHLNVNAGTTLGGRGFLGGTEQGNVSVTGTAANPATVAPGSIDETTGAHLFGTLTVGSESRTNLVSFGANSKLRVSVGERGEADSLVVYGAVDLSGDTDALELTLDGNRGRIRGGRYVIVSATEGITGTFESVTLPRGVRLIVEPTRILADVPDSGTVLIVR